MDRQTSAAKSRESRIGGSGRHALACGLVGFVLAAYGSAASAETEMFSDSGIDGPPYQQIYNATGALATSHPDWARVSDYGTSPGGRGLRVIRIQNPNAEGAPSESAAKRAVLISGSTHGNEYLNIEDRLAPWFLDNRARSPGLARFLATGGILYVVPILNPDGYDHDRRENDKGVDLNRDFDLVPADEPGFTQPETRLLAEWVERDLRASNAELKLTVDYHCCDGSLLYPWSYVMSALPPADAAAHAEIGRLMQTDINDAYATGSTGQVLGYNPRGTSKDYYYARYGALAFTFEGSYGDEDTNFPKHTQWWDHVLAVVAAD